MKILTVRNWRDRRWRLTKPDVGGKRKNKHGSRGMRGRAGEGDDKVPVLGTVERGGRVTNAADTPLYQAPESLNGLGMNVAPDVHALGVLDAPMLVSVLGSCQPIINRILVSKDGGIRQHALGNDGIHGFSLNVGSDASNRAPDLSYTTS